MTGFKSTALGYFLLLAISTSAWSVELEGTWQEYDEHSGKPEALISITKLPDNTYSGEIIKIFPDSLAESGMLCSKCPGSFSNQPLLGLRILSGLKRKDDLNFDGGNILDPDEGKIYQCRIRLSEDGTTIEVTGYISFAWLGQSETWRRLNDDSSMHVSDPPALLKRTRPFNNH